MAPYLEIRFEDPDNLSIGWPEDGDGFDWQVLGLEAQLGGRGRGDHSGSELRVLAGRVIELRPCCAPLCGHRFRPSYDFTVCSPRQVVCFEVATASATES